MKRYIIYSIVLIFCCFSTSRIAAQVLFTNDGQTISITNGAQLTIEGDAVNNGILTNEGTITLSGDWTNAASYLSDAGVFILNSSDIQLVDHGSGTFFILELAGGGRKIFDSDIEIISSLILISGVAEIPTDRTFLLREGVTVSGGADDAYVEGTVFASGTGNLLFPIGRNGIYSPVELLDVSGTAPVTGMTVSEPNPASVAGFGISDISTERYWQRELRSGTFESAQIKLSIRDEPVISDPSDAVVAGTNSLGGIYNSLGQSAVSGTASSGSVTSATQSDDLFYAIGRTLNEGRLADSTALISLFNNNPGAWIATVNWTDPSLTLDEWTNIELNADGRVESLVITGGSMSGELTPDLRVLTDLTTLDLSDNELSGRFPETLLQLTSLEELDVSGNMLESIPDFSSVVSLTSFDARSNNLLFSSLENNHPALQYDPQDSIINTGASLIREPGFTYTMSVPDDSPNNNYQWIFNGAAIAGATSPDYVIQRLDRSSMGTYYCEVTNTVVTDLTLYSRTYTIFAEASISGTISSAAGPVITSGTVTLLRVTSNGAYKPSQPLPLSPTGAYSFTDTLADYVVLVDPFDDEAYIPTYHEQSIQWDLADVIALDRDTTGIDILVAEKPEDPVPDDGNGTFFGDVFTDFPEDTEGRIEARRRVRRVGVALRRRRSSGRTNDDEFALFAYTETDSEGKFSFDNLPPGLYRIYIEFPGIPIDEEAFTEFELGEDLDENAVQIEAIVFEDGIEINKVEETGIPYDYLNSLSIYPNPANNGFIHIGIDAKSAYEIRLELLDLNGVPVVSEKLNHQNVGNGVATVDITGLSTGLYLIKISVPSHGDQLYRVGKLMVNGR
ncbi:MAG: T9SS type A sorting domain-containing protein [Cyclobacteriaceae bacterium]